MKTQEEVLLDYPLLRSLFDSVEDMYTWLSSQLEGRVFVSASYQMCPIACYLTDNNVPVSRVSKNYLMIKEKGEEFGTHVPLPSFLHDLIDDIDNYPSKRDKYNLGQLSPKEVLSLLEKYRKE